MTQEQKARAYDEALKRAKKYNIDDAYASQGALIKSIFRELSESEDERIRKAIVHLLEVASEAYLIEATGFKKEQFLSYLEKQKEQKPEVNDPFDDEQFRRGYEAGKHDAMREQKPAEWSEEEKDKVAQYLHDMDGGMLWSKATEITGDILDMLHPSWKPSEEQMEVDLEKASRNVYESWMGGTMNDVRRDMVELGKVLNARKEDEK